MSAWVSRERRDKSGKLTREKMPPGVRQVSDTDRFVVRWIDPDRRQRQERIRLQGKPGKRLADERAKQITSQLTLGLYEDKSNITWADFRKEFEAKCIGRKAAETQRMYRESLKLFEQICGPKLVRSISSHTVDSFRCGLESRRGVKPGSTISAAGVNKHLRGLRVALRKAHAWEYLTKMPQIEMAKEPEKEPLAMEAAHFDAIYEACNVAEQPAGGPYTAEQWWKSLILTGLMTGMRISEMLTLLWSDVRLDENYLTVRHSRSKAKRDDTIPLHSVVVDHLRKITDVGLTVFDWPLRKRDLYDQWHAIQEAAEIHLPCLDDGEHECTPSCHVYGFHSLKKACGTLNAARLPEAALNAFMRHSSGETTRKYYQNGRRIAEAVVDSMYVPKVAVRSV
ncbi:MAG: site-specific integrase [Planctomycetes bacterium]|nr:site-specific integrase [Planctomycetota bacterium]